MSEETEGPRSRPFRLQGFVSDGSVSEGSICGNCDGSVSEGDFCGDLIWCKRCRGVDFEQSQEGSIKWVTAGIPTKGIACAPKDFQVGDCVFVGDDDEGIITELDSHRCVMVATVEVKNGKWNDMPLSKLRLRVHDPPGGAVRADAHERIIEEQSATAVAASSPSSSTGAAMSNEPR